MVRLSGFKQVNNTNQPSKMRSFFKIMGMAVLVLVILLLLVIIALYFYLTAPRQPKFLSNKTEVIEVSYVNWACDCANFYLIPSDGDWGEAREEIRKEDYIFIEPAFAKIKIDEDDLHRKSFDYTLRLTGQYYVDKGVPDSYERKIQEYIPRIDSAKVFRYESYQYIRKENAKNR